MPTRPPDAPIASSCSSVRLRADGASAWQPECDAISGPASSRATSQNPASFMWLRSTAMPSCAQRRTSAAPAGVRPGPVSGDDGNANGTPCANAFGRLQTGPSDRRPAACQRSSASRSGSIASAPSRCSTAASTPSASAPSRSPAVRAITHVPARARARAGARRTRSRARQRANGRRGRRAARRRPPPGVGVKIAKMPPARPPARARGRSRCPPLRPPAKASASSRVSVSLWPSKTGTGFMPARRATLRAASAPSRCAARRRRRPGPPAGSAAPPRPP